MSHLVPCVPPREGGPFRLSCCTIHRLPCRPVYPTILKVSFICLARLAGMLGFSPQKKKNKEKQLPPEQVVLTVILYLSDIAVTGKIGRHVRFLQRFASCFFSMMLRGRQPTMTAGVFQSRWCHEEVLCSRPAEVTEPPHMHWTAAHPVPLP